MKRLSTIVFAIFFIAVLVTTTFAQAKPADEPEQKAAPKAKTFKGEFASMDATAKTIVARDAKGEMTFDVSGVKKPAEFKAGEKIMVMYIEIDGKKMAKTIVKQAAKKEAQKKEEGKQAPAKGEPAKPVDPANK